MLSIVVLAYNNLEYTRMCIESIYKYTSSIDFELITINNGSSDNTGEYFNSLPNEKKLDFKENRGCDLAVIEGFKLAEGEYILFVSNDIVYTKNAIENMLGIIRTDRKIGMVVPLCNSTSYCQQMDINYNDMDEMQEFAEKFNISNADLWEERVQLVTYTFLSRKELMDKYISSIAVYNPGSIEDNDISFRLRRAGFRLILGKDTFVHHFGTSAFKELYENNNTLIERNRKIFYSRYGVDGWDDTIIDWNLIRHVDFSRKGSINILGINPMCGASILRVKGEFRSKGQYDVNLYAFTEFEKYEEDLNTICTSVCCRKMEDFKAAFSGMEFDIIIMESSAEGCGDIYGTLKAVKSCLKEDGQFIFMVNNGFSYLNINNSMNNIEPLGSLPYHYSYSNKLNLINTLNYIGFKEIGLYGYSLPLNEAQLSLVKNIEDIEKGGSIKAGRSCLNFPYIVFSIKGKNTYKNVLLYPGYDMWLNNGIFTDKSYNNFLGVYGGICSGQIIRETFENRGYKLMTIDMGPLEDADYIIFYDTPKRPENHFFRRTFHTVCRGGEFFRECVKRGLKDRMALVLYENPAVMPENYAPSIHENFNVIFTWNDDLVDNKKYFKINYTCAYWARNYHSMDFKSKKLLTSVIQNKSSDAPGELYSERFKAVKYFEEKHPDDFDFYGAGWDTGSHRCFRGSIPGKMEVLSKYRFSICYENYGGQKGYITEKIFDSFLSGCVPIYLGAPNITDHVPADTFIDLRKFSSYDELYEYLSSMGEKEYNDYKSAINDFMESQEFLKFTDQYFASAIIDVLSGKSGRDTSKEAV